MQGDGKDGERKADLEAIRGEMEGVLSAHLLRDLRNIALEFLKPARKWIEIRGCLDVLTWHPLTWYCVLFL